MEELILPGETDELEILYEIAKEELCKFMDAMKQFKMDPTVRITKLKSLKKQK